MESNLASNYYYLVASLPELDFEEGVRFVSPELLSQEKEGVETKEEALVFFLDEVYFSLREGLGSADQEALCWLGYPVDNRNFISAYCKLNRPFLEGGNFSQEELNELLTHPGELPGYFQNFFDLYSQKNQTEEFPANFLEDALAGIFYEEVLGSHVKYLRRWFSFKRDLGNLLTAMQSRRFSISLEKRERPRPGQSWAASLVGDTDGNRAMQESKAYDFGLSGEFSWMSRILNIEKAPAAVLDRGIEKLRWEMAHEICRELTGEELFSLEYILSYSIRLQIARRRLALSPQRGEKQLHSLQKSLVENALGMVRRQTQEAQINHTSKEAG